MGKKFGSMVFRKELIGSRKDRIPSRVKLKWRCIAKGHHPIELRIRQISQLGTHAQDDSQHPTSFTPFTFIKAMQQILNFSACSLFSAFIDSSIRLLRERLV